jgi:hypothetical protein
MAEAEAMLAPALATASPTAWVVNTPLLYLTRAGALHRHNGSNHHHPSQQQLLRWQQQRQQNNSSLSRHPLHGTLHHQSGNDATKHRLLGANQQTRVVTPTTNHPPSTNH